MMDRTALVPPLIARENGDTALIFFESVDEALTDRYDIMWGETYEGWDSTGRRFTFHRVFPPEKCWHKIFGIDRSYFELITIEEQPSPRVVTEILIEYLKLPWEEHYMAVASLIEIGLDRETRSRAQRVAL